MSSSMHTVMLAAVLSLAGTALASDKGLPAAHQANSNDAVSGRSLEDSLQACLARIPKDATPRQKMLFEQACRRAEANRAPVQLVNGKHMSTSGFVINKEETMNQEQFGQFWTELKAPLRAKWERITDVDLTRIEGILASFQTVVHERYGE